MILLGLDKLFGVGLGKLIHASKEGPATSLNPFLIWRNHHSYKQKMKASAGSTSYLNYHVVTWKPKGICCKFGARNDLLSIPSFPKLDRGGQPVMAQALAQQLQQLRRIQEVLLPGSMRSAGCAMLSAKHSLRDRLMRQEFCHRELPPRKESEVGAKYFGHEDKRSSRSDGHKLKMDHINFDVFLNSD